MVGFSALSILTQVLQSDNNRVTVFETRGQSRSVAVALCRNGADVRNGPSIR